MGTLYDPGRVKGNLLTLRTTLTGERFSLGTLDFPRSAHDHEHAQAHDTRTHTLTKKNTHTHTHTLTHATHAHTRTRTTPRTRPQENKKGDINLHTGPSSVSIGGVWCNPRVTFDGKVRNLGPRDKCPRIRFPPTVLLPYTCGRRGAT